MGFGFLYLHKCSRVYNYFQSLEHGSTDEHEKLNCKRKFSTVKINKIKNISFHREFCFDFVNFPDEELLATWSGNIASHRLESLETVKQGTYSLRLTTVKWKKFVTQANSRQKCSFEKWILMICKRRGRNFFSTDQIFIHQTLLFDVVYVEREYIMSPACSMGFLRWFVDFSTTTNHYPSFDFSTQESE